MAAVVQAVQLFQPGGWAGKQIPESGDVVGEDRAGGSGEKLDERVVLKKGGSDQHEKKAEGYHLVGGRHGQDSLESNFSGGRGGDPVTDAGIPVRKGV